MLNFSALLLTTLYRHKSSMTPSPHQLLSTRNQNGKLRKFWLRALRELEEASVAKFL
jgi:hypothetical protein